jgi:serine/threonine protein kinase/Cdc6-like AAA superfamily ATPase
MSDSVPTDLPGVQEARAFRIEIPLRDNFRYVHEPIHVQMEQRFVGRTAEIQDLVQRILHSEGGSFLITGYRGVGKTSFVNQVLNRLGKEILLLDIHVNLARPLQPSELMHLIVRRLYDRLIEKDLYRLLSSKLQTQLALAYQRTSANLVRKVSEGWESGLELNELKVARHAVPFTPKISAKRSRTIDLETSFLAYDDKAAEHDVISISHDLLAGIPIDRKLWRSFFDWLSRRKSPRRQVKIVFVFDEMDKLDERIDKDTNKSAVDEMLSSLKTLFTTSGICFLFVAGKDLHERWLEDLWRGNSIYESVFSYDRYLSCMWDDLEALCAKLTLLNSTVPPVDIQDAYRQTVFSRFKKYLGYKGRGIPRRILRAFNEMVTWEQGRPVLSFSNEDLKRVTFFADLNNNLELQSERLFGYSAADVSGTRQDRRRLGVYYLVDWILRRGSTDFTAADLINASRRLSSQIALAEEIATSSIIELLDVLTAAEYIQLVTPRPDEVAIGDDPAAQQKRYRLVSRRLAEMSGLGAAFENEKGSFATSEERTPTGRIGRFELYEKLGSGGMGEVYRARDTASNILAAVKVLNQWLAANEKGRDRFRREFNTLKNLRHENIVRFYEAGESGTEVFLAMELVDGINLKAILEDRRSLEVDIAIAILLPIAEAVRYSHRQGFFRLDIKPGNIMVDATGHVYLTDVGIAKTIEVPEDTPITREGDLIGTPFYSAPEQFSAESSADHRSDIYAFGVVLYETITGVRPFRGESIGDVLLQHLHSTPIPPAKVRSIPLKLNSIVLRCLEKDPNQRFQSMAEVVEQLQEWSSLKATMSLTSLVAEVRRATRTRNELQNSLTQTFEAPAGPAATHIPPHPEPSPRPPSVSRAAVDAKSLHTDGSPAATAALRPPPESPELIINEPDHTLFSVILTSDIIGIGRAPDNTVELKNTEGVSRYHARVLRQGDQFVLMDLNSSNGTYLNGVRVFDPVSLSDKDSIYVGQAQLVFKRN